MKLFHFDFNFDRYTGWGGGGGGGRGAGVPRTLGYSDFLGSKRNLGVASL